jgi:biopolymer transport protein ExbD
MVSSTLIVHSGMKVKLPSAKNTGSVKQEKLIVYIDDKNNVYLNKIKVSKKELSSKIMENLKKGGKPFVTVKADKKVQYENIINIIDICKDSGIKDISFATNKQKNVNYE